MIVRRLLSVCCGGLALVVTSMSTLAREIVVENDCERFSFILHVRHYESRTSVWETNGYIFSRSGYGHIVFLTKEVNYQKMELDTGLDYIFFYAKPMAWDNYVWRGDDYYGEIRRSGETITVGFRKHRNTGYHHDLIITCNNIQVDEDCWENCSEKYNEGTCMPACGGVVTQ